MNNIETCHEYTIQCYSYEICENEKITELYI